MRKGAGGVYSASIWRSVGHPTYREDPLFVRNTCIICRVPEDRLWKARPPTLQSGERTNTEGKPVSNKLLLSIADSDYSSLRPHLEYVSLPNHLVLHDGGGKLEFAYFPNRGLISLVVVMKDGKLQRPASLAMRAYRNTGGSWPEQEPASSGGTNHGKWVSGNGSSFAKHFGIRSTPAMDVEPLCRNSGYAGCTNSRV